MTQSKHVRWTPLVSATARFGATHKVCVCVCSMLSAALMTSHTRGTQTANCCHRYGNPTTRVVEEKLRELEGAEDCLVSSSGMNSATTMLLALVPAGGHIITTTDCYRRTRQFIQTVLPKMGVTATVLDPSDMGALEKALEEHDNTSVYFSESPTNPYLR